MAYAEIYGGTEQDCAALQELLIYHRDVRSAATNDWTDAEFRIDHVRIVKGTRPNLYWLTVEGIHLSAEDIRELEILLRGMRAALTYVESYLTVGANLPDLPPEYTTENMIIKTLRALAVVTAAKGDQS